MAQGAWIAVDWGTTHLRAWAIGADGAILAQAASDDGMGALAPGAFEPALLALIGDWLDQKTLVLACGMVGARQGWVQAPYASAPCRPPGVGSAVPVLAQDARLDVRILPGVMQAAPPDVMRGEETQIAGFLAAEPKFDGVICLPGTHAKWVRISAGEIVSFRSFMTGELFALLSGHSVLAAGMATEGWDNDAFDDGVRDAMDRPHLLTSDLFTLRAVNLLDSVSPEAGRSRLSGLLVGLELAGSRPYWLGQRVAMIGAPALTALHARALTAQGVTAEVSDSALLTLAGLGAAYHALKEAAS